MLHIRSRLGTDDVLKWSKLPFNLKSSPSRIRAVRYEHVIGDES